MSTFPLNKYFVFPSVHPFLWCTIFFMSGIALQAHSSFFYAVSAGLILGTLSLLLVNFTKASSSMLLLAPLLITGALIHWYQESAYLSFYEHWDKDCVVQGTVSSIEWVDNPRFSYKISLNIDKIKKAADSGWCSTEHTFALYVRHRPDCMVADTIEVAGIIIKKPANKEFLIYLFKEKIAATLFAQHMQSTLISRPAYSFSRFLYYYKEHLLERVSQTMNEETFALVSSIFLGSKSNVKSSMEKPKESFKIWGISHQLARSGLHLVFLAIVWHFLCSILPLPFFYKQLLLVILISTYALLSWASISFTRAFLMFLFYKWYTLARAPTHYVHLISLVTFLVLINNPFQLFFLDFQLSFGLTFALAWLSLVEGTKKRLTY